MKRKMLRNSQLTWKPHCELLEDRRVLAVFTVTNLLDAGAGSLRDAVSQANLMAGADVIGFQAGLSGTIPIVSGELQVTDEVVIDGKGATIALDAAGAASRVFNVDDGDAGTSLKVTIEQLTLQGANVANGMLPHVFGGGIRNAEDLTVVSAIVTGNTADNGGGISNVNDGELTLQDTVVEGNTALNRGGGVYNGAGGVLIVTDSRMDGNNSFDLGGGLLTGSGTEVTITNSSVDDNISVGRGGGIYASSLGTGVAVSLTIAANSTVSRNTGDDGGGIMIGSAVTAVFSHSNIENNHSLDRGGGIHVSGFSSVPQVALNLQNVKVLDNVADDDGGGIHVGTSATLTINDSNIDSNSAVSRGGGINMSGFASAFTSIVQLTDSSVSGNSTMDDGGGIHTGSAAELTVIDSVISDNYAYDRGGGFRISGFGNTLFPNVTTIQGTTISSNVSNDAGAGIYSGSATNTTITTSSITGNSTGADAGGISVLFGGTTTIDKSTIAYNVASGEAGGIDVSDSNLSITESTISGNTATMGGSGLHASMDPLTTMNYAVAVAGSTVANNVSVFAYGGGICLQSTYFSLTGSIVSGNASLAGTAFDLYDYTKQLFSGVDVSYSLIGNNEESGLMEANPDANGNIVGGPVGGVIDPLLSALAGNGGPTMTHLPSTGSPAIDTGDPLVMFGTDQRGRARVSAGRVDMGSVEVQLVDGDFNDDEVYDCFDVNALSAQIAAATNASNFDLTQDGVVDLADLTAWLSEAGDANLGPGLAYLPADADLNGMVDGDDFMIWNMNKFSSNDAFCSADFNADGHVDGLDFLIWNSVKFMSSDTIPPLVTPALPKSAGPRNDRGRSPSDGLADELEFTRDEPSLTIHDDGVAWNSRWPSDRAVLPIANHTPDQRITHDRHDQLDGVLELPGLLAARNH